MLYRVIKIKQRKLPTKDLIWRHYVPNHNELFAAVAVIIQLPIVDDETCFICEYRDGPFTKSNRNRNIRSSCSSGGGVMIVGSELLVYNWGDFIRATCGSGGLLSFTSGLRSNIGEYMILVGDRGGS